MRKNLLVNIILDLYNRLTTKVVLCHKAKGVNMPNHNLSSLTFSVGGKGGDPKLSYQPPSETSLGGGQPPPPLTYYHKSIAYSIKLQKVKFSQT